MAIGLPSDVADMPVDAIPGEGLPIAAPPAPAAPAAPQEIDNLMTLASAPPPAVPLTPVDAALAPALPPDGGAALPVSPSPTLPPPSPVANAARNVEETRKLGEEQVANAETAAADKAKEAEAKAQFEREREAALQKLQERQEMHRHAAQAEVSAARAKAEGEPYHTFWENRSIAQNVATGIGLILSGVSWNPAHTNRGVDILNKAMDQDLAIQKEKHANLWRAVNEAQDGQRTLDTTHLRELSAFSAAEGAKWDRVSTQLAAAVAMNKGKGDVTAAKKAALEANEKANTFYEHATSAAATASHLDEQEKELARHHLEQEKTAAIRAAKYKARGTGGGGGTGKPFEDAISAMQEAADAGKSYGQIVIAGRTLGRKEAEKQATAMINARGKQSAADARELKISEADAAKTVHWKGRDFIAPRANEVPKIAKDLSNMEKYNDLIREVAEDIKNNGFIVDPGGTDNPLTEKGKRRMSLMAEVQALGRQISALQATDAGQKLEGQMIGHAGVGLRPGQASPDALEELRKRALKLVNTKLGVELTPADKKGGFSFEGGGGGEDRGKHVRQKSTGKTGYLKDGVFTPDADVTL